MTGPARVPLSMVVSTQRHEVFRQVVAARTPSGDVVGFGGIGLGTRMAGEAGKGSEGGKEVGVFDPRGLRKWKFSLRGRHLQVSRHC